MALQALVKEVSFDRNKVVTAHIVIFEEGEFDNDQFGYIVSNQGVHTEGVVHWDHLVLIETAWEHLQTKKLNLLEGMDANTTTTTENISDDTPANNGESS